MQEGDRERSAEKGTGRQGRNLMLPTFEGWMQPPEVRGQEMILSWSLRTVGRGGQPSHTWISDSSSRMSQEHTSVVATHQICGDGFRAPREHRQAL